MSRIRGEACSACPYRQDAPPGLWAADEYAKLPPYDGETWEQPHEPFACHATPDRYCHGWAVVGGTDLLALRLRAAHGVDVEIPEPSVPLFGSGLEAAVHGLSALDVPPEETVAMQRRLLRKHPRLRTQQRKGTR